MNVLVAGGAGFIGAHVVVELVGAGHAVTIADNFSNSQPSVVERIERLTSSPVRLDEVDLTSQSATDALFAAGDFDAVIHCAGYKAVGESVNQPLEYYSNNIGSTLSILSAMRAHDVRRLVFSSSATVYGPNATVPFDENASPLESSNPYGQTKVMIERILTDFAAATAGCKVALLRYFNPVGAHESGLIGESPRGVPNNLMPYLTQTAAGRRPLLTVHGGDYDTVDGTGERDYIHVVDLATGHLAALEHLESMAVSARAFNLGTGRPTSVVQLIEAFENATGVHVPYTIGPRRPGDLSTAYADPSRARAELQWRATRSVEQMCTDSWRWELAQTGTQPVS